MGSVQAWHHSSCSAMDVEYESQVEKQRAIASDADQPVIDLKSCRERAILLCANKFTDGESERTKKKMRH